MDAYVGYTSLLYRDVPPSVHLLRHFLVILGVLSFFGPGFYGTYTSDIIMQLIIGIRCMFLCTIVCDTIRRFIYLIKTTWNT